MDPITLPVSQFFEFYRYPTLQFMRELSNNVFAFDSALLHLSVDINRAAGSRVFAADFLSSYSQRKQPNFSQGSEEKMVAKGDGQEMVFSSGEIKKFKKLFILITKRDRKVKSQFILYYFGILVIQKNVFADIKSVVLITLKFFISTFDNFFSII